MNGEGHNIINSILSYVFNTLVKDNKYLLHKFFLFWLFFLIISACQKGVDIYVIF